MNPIHLEQTRFQRTDEAASAMAEHRRLVREGSRRGGEHRTNRFSRQVAAVPMLGRLVVGRDCGAVR